MSRVVNAALSLWLALGLLTVSSCVPPPNPYVNAQTGSAKLGSSTAPGIDGSYAKATPAPTSPPPAPLKDATVDQSQSRAVSDYLKSHHLPLVGAQVLTAPGGQRQVILFGYVATQYGKSDAETRVRKYLADSNLAIDNRITVSPELASANPSSSVPPANSSAAVSNGGGNWGGVQDYQNQGYNDPYQQSQQYQYQSQGPSALSTLIPLLGLLGGSFGAGNFSGSYGGFGGGYGPYGGGYGYPTYPPPGPSGFGYGPPYSSYP
jgi:hypothetical protein